MQFENIHIADGNRLSECIAGAPIVEWYLPSAREAGRLKLVANLISGRARKRRHNRLVAKRVRRKPEVHLKNLPEVHTRRNAERRENKVYWIAVFVVRHIFNGEHARDDALVAVTPRELVADRDVTHLRDGNDNLLDDAALQLVAPVLAKIFEHR